MFSGVFISSALFNLSGMISDSLLSLYAKSTGAAPDQIGSLISLFALTALIFRLMQGIGNAFGNACMLTIVSECIPKDKFFSGMGIFTLAQVMSQALGPRIGIMIRDLVGYNTIYLITCGMMALSIVLTEFLVRVPDRSTGRLVLIGYATSLWHILVIAVINSLGYGAVQPSLSGLTMK